MFELFELIMLFALQEQIPAFAGKTAETDYLFNNVFMILSFKASATSFEASATSYKVHSARCFTSFPCELSSFPCVQIAFPRN
jgi:hypothetical protein